MITWITEQYSSNDFLVGMTGSFLLAAFVMIGHQMAYAAGNALLRNFTVSIRLNNDIPYYSKTCDLVYLRWVRGTFRRRLALGFSFQGRSGSFIRQPGYGTHLAWVDGCPAIFNRQSEESQSSNFKEYFELRVLTLRPQTVMAYVVEQMNTVADCGYERNYLRIYASGESCPDLVTRKPKRSMDTIRMSSNVKQQVLSHIDDFLASREHCEEHGLPWHTGILFYGSPGTGKTSMTHVIASYLDRDIHFHSSGKLSRQNIDPRQCILALEDFDASAVHTSKEDRSRIETSELTGQESMADVLNYLDSFLTPHGLVTVATTNHFDTLDPALIRPGRFNLVIDMDAATRPAMPRQRADCAGSRPART